MAEKIIVAGTIEGGVWSKSLEQHKRVYDTSGIAPTLAAGGGGNLEKKITETTAGTIWGSKQEHCSVRNDGICPTLTEAMGMGGGQIPRHNYDFRIRKLTPRECFRLMDFDDVDFVKAKYKLINDDETAQWFLEQEKKVRARTMKPEEWKEFYVYLREKHERVSDSQLYKQAGNSIVVAVLEAIFKQMF